MQAIVPAAGRGERMMPLTTDTPKPLLEIAGRPMMTYVIDLLVAHGFDEIGVNLFYLGDQIKDYFGKGSKFGAKIIYVEEKELTGIAGAVRNVAAVLKPTAPFFVISSDMMVNFDLTAVYKFHQEHGGIATLCCYWRPRDQLKKSGVILFDETSKQIKEFVERPQTDEEIISQWVNSSVYLFDPRILSYIPERVGDSAIVDLPKHVFPKLLASGEKMFAYPIDQTKFYQLGVDTPDRIDRVADDIASGKFVPTHRK